jgi:hypothetical protein
MRRDLGYRLVNPVHLVSICGILAVVAILNDPTHPQAKMGDLLAFALLAFAIGMFQRLIRWFGVIRGVRHHSYYIGTSFFDFRWLPKIVRRNRIMARYFDPICCGFFGWHLIPISPALGSWLIFSAIALRCFEDTVRRKERRQHLDMLDTLIASEYQNRTVQEYEEAAAARPQLTPTGIPTGLGSDIREQVKRRKAELSRSKKWF